MKKLTILVTPLNAVGHVTACIGAMSCLLRRGHRIIFILEQSFSGQAIAHGLEEHLMTFPKRVNEANPVENAANQLLASKIIGNYTAREKMENLLERLFGDQFLSECALYDAVIREGIQLYTPDLIYFDALHLYPAIHFSAIPWILNISSNPLYYIDSEHVPPGCSGLPEIGREEEANAFRILRKQYFNSVKYGRFIESLGYERIPGDQLFPSSQVLTVYACPEEMNYSYVRSLDWFNLEVFNKKEDQQVIDLKSFLPDAFFSDTLDGTFSGKWIYLSLGSMGSIDLTLMRRLVAVLAGSRHKYIVSKGPRHGEFNLPRNMWGERFLPQMQIVPVVDLVITHGGNNTLTETFAQGKPMIVLPLFGDQLDNGQRLQETRLGSQMHPYNFTDNELLDTVECLLKDSNLNEKLQKAARRIQASNRHEELAIQIEQLVDNLKPKI